MAKPANGRKVKPAYHTGRRGARGWSPNHYPAGHWVPLACRMPEHERRLVDYLALSAGVTPSFLARLAIARLLADLGFPLQHEPAALPEIDRAKLALWLVEQERAAAVGPPPDESEPPGGTG
jgi:hypothetical protein